ncbi:MAG TPA: sialidase family protein [Candidatus Competibacteraceae bacterium]|nr:sialidase family protein [Candidatus Competibacteraceae bacterium]
MLSSLRRASVVSVLLCLSLLALPGFAQAAPAAAPATVVEAVPAQSYDLAPSVVSLNGQQAVLFVNPQGRIALRLGEQVQTLDDGTEKPGGQYVRLHFDGERLYALWWQKLNNAGKKLYLRVSEDGGKTFGPVVTLNSGLGVLPVYQIASDGQGRVVVVWYDERQPRFQIYLNRSLDGGKTWLEQDVRLDSQPVPKPPKKGGEPFAIEPSLVFHGERLVAVWKERRETGDKKAEMLVLERHSDDGGSTWSPEVVVHRGADFLVSETLTSSSQGLWLVGYQAGAGLLAFRSDNGEKWEALGALEGSSGHKAISQIRSARLPERLALVYTLEPRDKLKKPQVHFAALDLAKRAWVGPSVRLDDSPYDATTAWTPDLLALPGGELLAVWEDRRNIRPSIFFTLSKDGGATWSKPARSLDQPGAHLWERPALSFLGDKVRVFFDQWRDDGKQVRDLRYLDLPYAEGAGLDLSGLPQSPAVDVEARKQRLKERAEALWKLRVEAKWEDAYQYLDPAYRAKNNLNQYLAYQGNIVYQSYEITDFQVWDNIGGVIVKINFKVPEMQVAGQPFKVDAGKDVLRSEWVWIENDWYMVQPVGIKGRSIDY